MNVLIIEDEDVAYRNLLRLLDKLDKDIHVLAWQTSIKSAINWLQNNLAPDLIFLDIHLTDGLAFEIFDKVKVHSPIIFTTADSKYAIKAFEVNSIDYLLKPIRQEKLEQSINKLRRYSAQSSNPINFKQIDDIIKQISRNKDDYKERFLIKTGDKFFYISTNEIAYFYAESNIIYLISNKDHRYIVNFSLEQLEGVLNTKDFFRVSRKYLIKISSIKSVNKYFNSRLKIVLNPLTEDEIFISRVRCPAFLNWLEGL